MLDALQNLFTMFMSQIVTIELDNTLAYLYAIVSNLLLALTGFFGWPV